MVLSPPRRDAMYSAVFTANPIRSLVPLGELCLNRLKSACRHRILAGGYFIISSIILIAK